MKICNECGAEKPLTEYYKNKPKDDSCCLYFNKCKDCIKADVKLNRENNIERIKEYDRNRPNKEDRNLKVKAKHKEKYASDEVYKVKIISAKDKWVTNNPLKRKAQYAASNALRGG